MRKIFYTILSLYTICLIVIFITFMTKDKHQRDTAEEIANTEAQCDSAVVNAIRVHSMLYTAEAKSQKTMTYTSNNKLSFKFMGIDKDMNLPFSKTEATIPVTVTYKAGINLQSVTMDNIQITQYPSSPLRGERGGSITITLPDPLLIETAVQVDHENEKMKKEFLGKGLTYEQYQAMLRQAKQEAWEELSEDDIRAIIETAKVSATDILLPQLRQLGFTDIQINFRQDLDYGSIERKQN